MIIYKYSIGDIMNLNEAVKELEEHGYLVEYTKDEYVLCIIHKLNFNFCA